MAVRSSYNKVMLIGNCTSDPEIRPQQQYKIATVTVATNDWKPDGNGSFIKLTEWHRVKFWNFNADKALNSLHRGTRVYIEGRISTNTYPDKTDPNVVHRNYEISADTFIPLDRRGGGDDYDQGNGQYNSNGGYGGGYNNFSQPQNNYNDFAPARGPAVQGYGGNFNNFGGGQNFNQNFNNPNNRNSNGMGGSGNGEDVPF